jgi:hypothetical protein
MSIPEYTSTSTSKYLIIRVTRIDYLDQLAGPGLVALLEECVGGSFLPRPARPSNPSKVRCKRGPKEK